MNPLKYAQMMKYLTRAKKANPDLPDVFPASKAPIPPKTQEVQEIEAINRFNRDNPRTEKAGGGMLVQPGFGGVRQGYRESEPAGERNYKNPNAAQKKFYKETTGKTWNKKDWDSGNYRRINKSRKAKDLTKKPQIMDPYYKKVGFFKQFEINQRVLANERELAARGYVSARKLNALLGRDNTESAIDDLKRVIDGGRESAWLNEKEGVAKWKKSKNLSFIDTKTMGQKFYKMPDKKTLKSMKDYYQKEQFLSDFKYGRIKKPSIDGAKFFYKDKELLQAIKKWSGSTSKLEMDENALRVINSVFGSDNVQGINAIKNLGRALKGEIKIEGIKKDVALGEKILQGVTRTANSRYSTPAWVQAAYVYARESMENVYQNSKGKGFKKLFDDIEKDLVKTLGKKRGKFAIDEVLSLRTGLTNDKQIYSVFTQVIDKGINENFKTTYDSNLSKNLIKIRKELAKGPEANFDEIKRITDQQNVKLTEANKKYPGIKFANLGQFDVETGKFAKPQDVFGRERFANLPSEIQKQIRKDYRTSGISLDVAGAGTQEEVLADIKNNADEIKSASPKAQANLLKKMGFKCKFAGSNGGLGSCDDPASYTDDINKTRQDLRSSDVTVRAAAKAKLDKGLQIAKTLPTIGKFLRRVGQATVGGVAKALEATGLATPVGVAIEAIAEGGIYDYYRKKGYTHDQAYQEGFITPMLTGRPEGVPWYGGAESMLEKELTEVREKPTVLEDGTIVPGKIIEGAISDPKILQYQKALEDQEQVFDAFARKEKFKQLEGTDQGTYKKLASDASADIQDLNRSGTISNINRIMNPESMASQAYQTAVERQAGAQDQRARDYMAENYVQTEPSDFEQKKLQRKRNEEMLQMFPTPTVEDVQDVYKAAGRGDELKYFQAQDYKDFMKKMDDYQKQSYFADNFRLEKAGGGIAKLAGVSSGPAPVRGPNSQGLLSLKNRVRNY